jgi:hypothetical protein
MKKIISYGTCAFISAALTAQIFAAELSRDILGLRLNMTKEAATKRLREIGTFVREERKQQEIWQVRHKSFSHIIIGLGKDGRLRFITAVAREDKDAKRFPYDQVGNLKVAQQMGDPAIKNFHYQWKLPAKGDNPATLVMARGRDPKYLSTYSLKSLD